MIQLSAALSALGLYQGGNTPAEHATEASRVGGENAYRVQLTNALLGAAQAEALVAESIPITPAARAIAYEQPFRTAGAADTLTKRFDFLRWQTLRISYALCAVAQNAEVGPIPLAAAHAAGSLQRLLSIIAHGQNLNPAKVREQASQATGELRAAREAMTNAIVNVDILLDLLEAAL